MDTNGDIRSMSHVGHLQTTPEFVRNVQAGNFLVVMDKFHKTVPDMSHWDIFSEMIYYALFWTGGTLNLRAFVFQLNSGFMYVFVYMCMYV